MRKLYTKHYKSKILNTKKFKILHSTYIGFKIEDLQNLKEFLTNSNIVEFNYKGFSFISQNNLNGNDLLWIDNVTEDNEWAVYKNTNNFVEHEFIISCTFCSEITKLNATVEGLRLLQRILFPSQFPPSVTSE